MPVYQNKSNGSYLFRTYIKDLNGNRIQKQRNQDIANIPMNQQN